MTTDRLLRTIWLCRRLLLFAMLAAAMLIGAAVIARDSAGLALAAKVASLVAALVAAILLVLNLLALRTWARRRRGEGGDGGA